MNGSSPVSIVVIGRNEGERLVASLHSALRASEKIGAQVVYVDSGSTDGSPDRARGMGVRVVELDQAEPMSAARARNAGLKAAMTGDPSPAYVQFLDGDCTIDPGWLDSARGALDAETNLAIVVGKLQERYPERTVYTRICALEWQSPPGELTNPGALGGIMAARVDVLTGLGGFNEKVIAGEDSELGVRVALAGFRVVRLAAPMAVHEADITRFSQWWRRSVRAGHAIGQRYHLNGKSRLRDCAREYRSTLGWGVGLPIVAGGLAVVTGGGSLALAGAYPLLGLRVYRRFRSQGLQRSEAALFATFTVLAKLANGIGLVKFKWNQVRDKYRIIEYK